MSKLPHNLNLIAEPFTELDEVIEFIDDCIMWHNGDKWRESEVSGEYDSWQFHKKRLAYCKKFLEEKNNEN